MLDNVSVTVLDGTACNINKITNEAAYSRVRAHYDVDCVSVCLAVWPQCWR